jgi:predicted transcriptional regulator
MADEPPAASRDRELTTNIVAAYVRRNQIASDHLATLISTVHQALSGSSETPARASNHRAQLLGTPIWACQTAWAWSRS